MVQLRFESLRLRGFPPQNMLPVNGSRILKNVFKCWQVEMIYNFFFMCAFSLLYGDGSMGLHQQLSTKCELFCELQKIWTYEVSLGD